MLFVPRITPRPIEYPEFEELWEKQNDAFWSHKEISLTEDIKDWDYKLPEEAKYCITNTLKLFAQLEMFVGDYWIEVARWFPKPEIQDMAKAFANMESMHKRAYIKLNDQFRVPEGEYTDFLNIPALKKKVDLLTAPRSDNPNDIAKSLSTFSAFTEGCTLFSTFALLTSFNREPHGLMPGLKQTIEWSARDESLHSEGGCALFKKMIEEDTSLWTPELQDHIYQTAGTIVELESSYLDFVFGPYEQIMGLTRQELLEYFKYRANVKLEDIGLNAIFPERSHKMGWFDQLIVGDQNGDFFVRQPTGYTKSANWDSMWN